MKRIKIIIPILILLLTVLLFLIFFFKKDKKVEPFYLDDTYYLESNLIETDYANLNDLINKKKSFGLFIYQPGCVTSASLDSVISSFQKEYKITFYKIPFSLIKKTFINDYVKYYPSFVIYKEGKLVDYLDASKDDDTKYFSDYNSFKTWFTSYVNLKEKNTAVEEKVENNDEASDNKDNRINLTADLAKIKEDTKAPYDNGKINIYLFWGNGCAHCKALKEFFNSINKEYEKYYNLHTFEVWYNSDNENLCNDFATILNDSVRGVPYTVIGSKSIKGFNESMKDSFISTIKEEYNKDEHYDVYEIIKNMN